MQNNISNHLNNVSINGNYVGRDYTQTNIIVQSPNTNIFSERIFLHYVGDKISKLLYSKNRELFVRKTNKILLFLFDDIIISISDLLQSHFIYDDFFVECLKHNNSIFTIVGNTSNTELERFIAEREEYYFKTNFYQKPNIDLNSFKGIILSYDATLPKRFKTKRIITNNWKNSFKSFNRDSKSVENYYLQNALIDIETNINRVVRKMIDLPDKLYELPFVWDSFKYLSILPKGISRDLYFELYLAAQWIQCYIDAYSCKIVNSTLGCRDCTLHITNSINISSIYSFLNNYHILEYILNLDFHSFIRLKFETQSCRTALQKILSLNCEKKFIINDDDNVWDMTNRIYNESNNSFERLKKQIELLYEKGELI